MPELTRIAQRIRPAAGNGKTGSNLFSEEQIQNMHERALWLVRRETKKHSFGELLFMAQVGTRPWGIAQGNVDFDYQAIYASKPDRTGQAFISGVYINNAVKDITMYSLEKIAENLFNSNIHPLIVINSPVIFAAKEFLEFRDFINANIVRDVCKSAQVNRVPQSRKDYLYNFFFMGNAIAALEGKKIIANLPLLNERFLKLPQINGIIEEERSNLEFNTEGLCVKTLDDLKKRLDRAYEGTKLGHEIDQEQFGRLRLAGKINDRFWRRR